MDTNKPHRSTLSTDDLVISSQASSPSSSRSSSPPNHNYQHSKHNQDSSQSQTMTASSSELVSASMSVTHEIEMLRDELRKGKVRVEEMQRFQRLQTQSGQYHSRQSQMGTQSTHIGQLRSHGQASSFRQSSSPLQALGGEAERGAERGAEGWSEATAAPRIARWPVQEELAYRLSSLAPLAANKLPLRSFLSSSLQELRRPPLLQPPKALPLRLRPTTISLLPSYPPNPPPLRSLPTPPINPIIPPHPLTQPSTTRTPDPATISRIRLMHSLPLFPQVRLERL